MVKATGRAALILSAVLFLFLGGASQAAPSAAGAKPDSASKPTETVKSAKYRRHHARHRTSKAATKSSDDKIAKKDPDVGENASPASNAMPAAVANANAQLAAADTPAAAAANAMTGRANENVQAAADGATPNNTAAAPAPDGQVVASDQLNEVDRALQQDNPPAQKTVLAAVDAQPRPAPVMAATSDSSTWDQTSLIGKIFIGFGALLTLASAVRMFMA